MKGCLKRLAFLALAVVGVVAIALGLAWWTTNPPEGYSAKPEGDEVMVAAPEGPISVGAAVVDITPAKLPYLGGFGHARRATGIHDPLYARALALQVGDEKVVLVAVDVIGVHAHHAARVRAKLALRVRPECLLVCATHDHSAPDTLGLWGGTWVTSGIDPAFLDQVIDGAARAAEKALDTLRPARLRLSKTTAPEHVSRNKRDPDVIDRQVLVLAADDLAGNPIATAVVFACHPEVMFGENTLVTADFPGVLLKDLESKRGGTGIFLNGPLGGMVTPDVKAHVFEEMDRVGHALSATAIAALDSAVTLERAPLTWVHRPITVPVQNRGYIGLRKLGVFDRPFEPGGYVESEVNALALGPLVLATVPGEALPRLGFDVKPEAPFSAVLALAGDELGYLIPEDAFEDPRRYSYEKTVSPGPLATTLIRKASLECVARASH
jgi:hypothetical protein